MAEPAPLRYVPRSGGGSKGAIGASGGKGAKMERGSLWKSGTPHENPSLLYFSAGKPIQYRDFTNHVWDIHGYTITAITRSKRFLIG